MIRDTKTCWKKIDSSIINRFVPIVGDKSVDSEFGTGCLKVFLHSEKDFEIGLRNNLDIRYFQRRCFSMVMECIINH